MTVVHSLILRPDAYARAVDLFTRTCAGYSVATYILGFGDKTTIKYRSKDVELMKLKLAKRGLKGTKIRV